MFRSSQKSKVKIHHYSSRLLDSKLWYWPTLWTQSRWTAWKTLRVEIVGMHEGNDWDDSGGQGCWCSWAAAAGRLLHLPGLLQLDVCAACASHIHRSTRCLQQTPTDKNINQQQTRTGLRFQVDGYASVYCSPLFPLLFPLIHAACLSMAPTDSFNQKPLFVFRLKGWNNWNWTKSSSQ